MLSADLPLWVPTSRDLVSVVEGALGIGQVAVRSSHLELLWGEVLLWNPGLGKTCNSVHVIVVSGHLGQGRDWTLCAIFLGFCFCFEPGSCYEQADLMYEPSASVSQVLGSQVCLICEVSVYMVCSGPLES